MNRPYLTSDLPGIGGVIKETPEDFRVDEIPAYLPSGMGEHLYIRVEKRGMTTLEAIRRIARHLGISEREVGYSGLKDARGVTTQYLSVGRIPPERLRGVELPGLRVLEAGLHGNKLRLGHLQGNRFTVTIRTPSGDRQSAAAILARLEQTGVPNYFGGQRYGAGGNSGRIGWMIVAGRYHEAVDTLIGSPESVEHDQWRRAIILWREGKLKEAEETFPPFCSTERRVIRSLISHPDDHRRALRSIDPRLLSLFLSAAQSELFDAVVARRIEERCFSRFLPGDIAQLHRNGACFRVTDPLAEQHRLDLLQISPTAPLFGDRMMLPEGETLCLETAVADPFGVSLDQRVSFGKTTLPGERRSIRMPVTGAVVESDGPHLKVSFTLPRGGYATTLLRELMKGGEVYNIPSHGTIAQES